MNKVFWTPRLYGHCDFAVYLNRDFAQEMIQSKISSEMQRRMNTLAHEELERLHINWISPYTFHADSGFITQFSIGQNGVWLLTNQQTIEDIVQEKKLMQPIEYHSHNVDHPTQVYALLVLFDKWIEYANAMRNL